MEIRHNILYKIEASDLDNGLLQIPAHVTSIADKALMECQDLKSVIFPDNLTHIGHSAFYSCNSLKEITIPSGVTKLSFDIFGECRNLTKVSLPASLITIYDSAFLGCENLSEIQIPHTVKYIGNRAFYGCDNLNEIILPSELEFLGNNSFSSSTKVIMPSLLKRPFNENPYEYLYNHLDLVKKLQMRASKIGKKYTIENFKQDLQTVDKDIDAKLQQYMAQNNAYLMNFVNYKLMDDIIERLDIIYPKTLFTKMPSLEVIMNFEKENLAHFDVKIWEKYAGLPLFEVSHQSKQALVVAMTIFGLFHKDEHLSLRTAMFENLFTVNDYTLTKEELETFINYHSYANWINGDSVEAINDCFTEIKQKEYHLNDGVLIPPALTPYISGVIDNSKYHHLRKITKNIGKELNDFIRENYQEVEVLKYKLTKSGQENKTLMKNLLECPDLPGKLNRLTLHRIFDGLPQIYSKARLDFILDNWYLILATEENQSSLKRVMENFDIIKNYFMSKGNELFDYHDALTFLNKQVFENVEYGNEEFAALVKNAGVQSQSTFEAYQAYYKNMRQRVLSTIPRYNTLHEVNLEGNDYQIRTKILSLKDPFTLLVGEAKYTNCCQTYGDVGAACMRHAASDGGIFCVYVLEDGLEKLLAQSWVWTNGNLLCFDNIEGTSILTTNNKKAQRKLYKKLTALAYSLAGADLIEESRHQMAQNLAKMDLTTEEVESIIKNQLIRTVTVGKGYDDLDCQKYFKQTKINVGPKGYNDYRDSYKQFLILGSESIKFNRHPDIPIYREMREIIYQEGEQIETSLIRDLAENMLIKAHTLYDYEEQYDIMIKDLKIVKGEDWAIVYTEGKILEIIEANKTKPRIADEEAVQNKEYQETLKQILMHAFKIDASGEVIKTKPIKIPDECLFSLEEIKKELTQVQEKMPEKNIQGSKHL